LGYGSRTDCRVGATMSASLEDVAARANVSPSTVSRALRGLPNVSARTRERVARAARDLDYVVNRQASGLATGRTGCVGVVVPFLGKWFFSEVLAGLDEVFRDAGRDLVLYSLGDAAGRDRFFVDLPMRQRVDGVVVLTVPLTAVETKALTSLAMPTVVVQVKATNLPGVRINDVDGASMAVRHLINLGHRRIGFITGFQAPPMHFTAPEDRRDGYRAALKERRLKWEPALEASGDFTVAGGASAMAALMSLPQPPTGVFVESDEMAIGALQAVRRMGLHVPADVSIVGFDDHEMAGVMDMTTVAQPVREQGSIAARMLIDILEGDSPRRPASVVVPTSLIVRGTTGPAPSRAARA
jgi:LacI family repressor for deo operon, udp, cdd, tsx, nupC, and nupG